MCFFLEIETVLERDTASTREAFRLPTLPPKLRFSGTFPRWRLIDGHCSCDLVAEDGQSIVLPGDLLHALLSEPNVKRLQLRWDWGDVPPAAPEVRLSIEDFEQLNEAKQLAAGTCYRINDPRKYAR